MTWLDRLRDDGLAIFLFHGVVERSAYRIRNYTRKHLETDAFANTLAALKRSGRAVSLDDVIEHHETGTPLPPRAFAVTFDDGFANNALVAAPVLSDLRIPATFYVTTDFVDANRMSWIDRIELAVEPVARARIRLPWGPRAFADVADARALLDEIRTRVKEDRRIDADSLASDLQTQLGLPQTWSSDDPLDRKLDWAEVRQLAGDALFTVGGHSHTHAILSFLDDDALDAEIDTSLRLLAERARIKARHYSYPEGLRHCYSDRVIRHLKKRAIRCCPTAEDGVNDHRTDLFRLKRITVT